MRDARPARRRPLSLASLIDVIFLLLLFFMLTTTFTRHGDLTLALAGAGATADAPPAFLRVLPDTLRLDTAPVALDSLRGAVMEHGAPVVLVAPGAGVDSQRLVDVLGALDAVPGVAVRVLGGG